MTSQEFVVKEQATLFDPLGTHHLVRQTQRMSHWHV